MANKALVLQDGKNVTVAGTANGQFLVNNGSNEVVFSSATVPTAGQVPVWSGSAWAPGANGSTGTVTSVSSSTTLSGLSLTTTNGTTTPAIALTGTLGVANGGTGATTLTGYVKGAGTAIMTAAAAIPVGDVTGAAPLDSPTFSGTPSLPTGTTGVTQSAGNNTTALATTAFVTSAVAASSGIPYDLPAEIPGTPATSTKVVNFKAVRAFILATTGHQGGQLTAPSGNFVCTVRKNATSLGTITFGVSSFSISITGTLPECTFAASDVLSVETPAAALGIDTPFFTLAMTLA